MTRRSLSLLLLMLTGCQGRFLAQDEVFVRSIGWAHADVAADVTLAQLQPDPRAAPAVAPRRHAALAAR